MQVLFLGLEDPLQKEMVIHFSVLAWEILWTEEPASYSPWGHKVTGQDLVTKQYLELILDLGLNL